MYDPTILIISTESRMLIVVAHCQFSSHNADSGTPRHEWGSDLKF